MVSVNWKQTCTALTLHSRRHVQCHRNAGLQAPEVVYQLSSLRCRSMCILSHPNLENPKRYSVRTKAQRCNRWKNKMSKNHPILLHTQQEITYISTLPYFFNNAEYAMFLCCTPWKLQVVTNKYWLLAEELHILNISVSTSQRNNAGVSRHRSSWLWNPLCTLHFPSLDLRPGTTAMLVRKASRFAYMAWWFWSQQPCPAAMRDCNPQSLTYLSAQRHLPRLPAHPRAPARQAEAVYASVMQFKELPQPQMLRKLMLRICLKFQNWNLNSQFNYPHVFSP